VRLREPPERLGLPERFPAHSTEARPPVYHPSAHFPCLPLSVEERAVFAKARTNQFLRANALGSAGPNDTAV